MRWLVFLIHGRILLYRFVTSIGPTTTIFIYTLYKERMPQENKPMNKMKKMIKEVIENLEDIKENQKRLEEEVKEIRSMMNIFTRFFVFICRASSSDSLLILCIIIVVFLTRSFLNLGFKSMELELLRCIVSLLERVVAVRPTYV